MTIDGAIEMQRTKLDSAIGIAVAKKSLDAARQQGAAAIQMLQAAAAVGGSSQALRSDPSGPLGSRLDTAG